jgi:hypothetical protein
LIPNLFKNLYLGGFSINAFARIAKYELDGWLGVVARPIEYIEDWMKVIKTQANQHV